MEKIKGFEDYGITSCGRVWSFYKNKFLTPFKDRDGYLRVNLYKNNKMYQKAIHRLVSEAYIPNHENLETVDHIDGNKENNFIKNLQWMTARDNVVKANAQKIMCVETGEIFESTRDASRKTKIPKSSIYAVLYKKLKKAGGYTWQRVTNDTLK